MMLRLLSYCFYSVEMLIGLFFELLFNSSSNNLLNENARYKLSEDFKIIAKKEKLRTIYQIAYSIQGNAFKLWQIRRGAINTHRLRNLGVFYEKFLDGEELIGSCFRLGVLPIPSAIIINKELKQKAARNIDCGFVFGYLVPSLRASLTQWIFSHFIKDVKKAEKVLKIITTQPYDKLLRSIFLRKFLEDTINFVLTNIVVKKLINDVENSLIPSFDTNLNSQTINTFIYKTRRASYMVDRAQDQYEHIDFMEKYADTVRNELKINDEDSFTKFFNCKQILTLAKQFLDVKMHDYDDSDRNICNKLNLEV